MSKIKIINILLISLIILLIIMLIINDKSQIIEQLNKWKMIPEPETFTELYFNNNNNLPSNIKQNQKIKFSFTIHNVEYKTITYPYNIYLNQNNKITNINKGKFTLNQGQYKTINYTYLPNNPIKRGQIFVNLVNKKQEIFFWLNGNPIKIKHKNTNNIKKTISSVNPQQQLKKHYGAWYWQPLIQKALMWLGLNKLGQDIWGNGVFITPTPTQRPSTSSSAQPTPTPTPISGIHITPTLIPTIGITQSVTQTVTPTNTQNK